MEYICISEEYIEEDLYIRLERDGDIERIRLAEMDEGRILAVSKDDSLRTA